ncbi:unnamed protein product [Heligmosomoides polygyrus]|uniref:ABC transporter ATP-binding protein n=1 Tax=Heligmosomoides polygyrus TaxID=6339 RepID=A0A183GNE6_HELPZ|nr:unnamed protein product [Heligmosomoides polygyrus]
MSANAAAKLDGCSDGSLSHPPGSRSSRLVLRKLNNEFDLQRDAHIDRIAGDKALVGEKLELDTSALAALS